MKYARFPLRTFLFRGILAPCLCSARAFLFPGLVPPSLCSTHFAPLLLRTFLFRGLVSACLGVMLGDFQRSILHTVSTVPIKPQCGRAKVYVCAERYVASTCEKQWVFPRIWMSLYCLCFGHFAYETLFIETPTPAFHAERFIIPIFSRGSFEKASTFPCEIAGALQTGISIAHCVLSPNFLEPQHLCEQGCMTNLAETVLGLHLFGYLG